MLTVACVYKTFSGDMRNGNHYTEEWVRRLARGVARNLSIPHRFVCMTDVDGIEGVETIPLRNGWVGWWSKLELFRPGLFDDDVLYIDLDIAICSSLDDMVDKPCPYLVMLTDYYPSVSNSSVMRWNAKDKRFGMIHDAFGMKPSFFMDKHKIGQIKSLGDQGFITEACNAMRMPILRWQDLLGNHRFMYYSAVGMINPAVYGEQVVYGKNGERRIVGKPIPRDLMMLYSLGPPKFDSNPGLHIIKENWT